MIGKQIICLDTVSSTNDYIKNNIDTLEDGCFVIAQQQTCGRGRHNNSWVSPLGNLYCSYLVKGNYDRENIFEFHTTTSIAIIKTLERFSLSGLIKFPNDIIVNSKKIAGILIETIGYEKIDYVIIGIGINLNQRDFFDLSSKATSISKEVGGDVNIESFIDVLLAGINNTKANETTFSEYLNKSIVINRKITYNGNESIIKQIKPNGKLVLENSNILFEVNYNEISLSEIY